MAILHIRAGRPRWHYLLAALGSFALLAGITYAWFVATDTMPRPFLPEPAPHPTPAATRDERWQQDIDYLTSQLAALHRNAFFRTSRVVFEARAEALIAQTPQLSDDAIIAGMADLAAMIGDGHTYLDVRYSSPDRPLLPLQLGWYGEDLIVTGAPEEYRDAIGARVTRIGVVSTDVAVLAMSGLIAHDNEQQLRNLSADFLRMPDMLVARGIAPPVKQVHFQLIHADGRLAELDVTPQPADASITYLNVYDVLPITPPLRTEGGERIYWYRYLPEQQAIYVQYNRAADDPNLPFAEFNRELFAFIAANPVERMVIDLRFNGGGSSWIMQPLIEALRTHPTLNQPNRVAVLIGARTFSSALMNAIELQEAVGATLIGMPTGGRPNGYGETRSFTLPNSGLRVQYSTRFFRNLPGNNAPALEPDILAPITWNDLLAGVDPAVERAVQP
jgi:hypothetical protein